MQSKVKVSLKKEHVWDLYDKIIFAKVIVYTSWFFLFFLFWFFLFFVFLIFWKLVFLILWKSWKQTLFESCFLSLHLNFNQMPRFVNVDCGEMEKVLLVHFDFLLLPSSKVSLKKRVITGSGIMWILIRN